jgi:hypothetical protein
LWQNRAYRSPGTTRARHRFVPEEIYFAVSKISRFPSVRYGFERQRTEVFCESCPGLVYALWMRDVANVTVPVCCKDGTGYGVDLVDGKGGDADA